MFMIFNKEFRQTEAIFDDLWEKVKKSNTMKQSFVGNTEVYDLDTVRIEFLFNSHELLVRDILGNEIISIDCRYYHSSRDELQYAKWNLFSGFLEKIRKEKNKRAEKEQKLKSATEKVKKAEEAKQKVISAQAAKESILNDALNKLRGM